MRFIRRTHKGLGLLDQMMATWFVGIGLPKEIRETLATLVPAAPGLRACHVDDLHFTLHYFGAAAEPVYQEVLGAVRVPGFEVVASGLGCFTRRNGASVLWAGLAANPGLQALHGALAAALTNAGFAADARPYTPHITLARGSPGFDREARRRYLAQAMPALPAFRVTQYHLYSSRVREDGSRYRIEASYGMD